MNNQNIIIKTQFFVRQAFEAIYLEYLECS